MRADIKREEVTTTVVRLRISTPAHWTDVSKVLHWARREVMEAAGLPADGIPADDAIWYEPGDEDIAICFEKRTVEQVEQP